MVIWLNQLFKNWNLFLQISEGQLLWAIALQPAPPIKLRQNSAGMTSAVYPDWLLIGQFPCQSVSKAPSPRWRLATSRDSRTSPAFNLGARPSAPPRACFFWLLWWLGSGDQAAHVLMPSELVVILNYHPWLNCPTMWAPLLELLFYSTLSSFAVYLCCPQS